jgi:hypothetical protein
MFLQAGLWQNKHVWKYFEFRICIQKYFFLSDLFPSNVHYAVRKGMEIPGFWYSYIDVLISCLLNDAFKDIFNEKLKKM